MPRGRKSTYSPRHPAQARTLAKLGMTSAEIAAFFAVTETTLRAWTRLHPHFGDALQAGRAAADAKVAASLYQRAIGYEHEAVNVFADPKTGAQMLVPYIERFPPDVAACTFWLKQRRPDLWSDKIRTEMSGPNGGPVQSVVRIMSAEAKRDSVA